MAEKDKKAERALWTCTQSDSDFLFPKMFHHILSYLQDVHVQIKRTFLCIVETPFGLNYNKTRIQSSVSPTTDNPL